MEMRISLGQGHASLGENSLDMHVQAGGFIDSQKPVAKDSALSP